jgi:hypothetical protein
MADRIYQTSEELEKAFTISIRPVEVNVNRSDEEHLSGDIKMSNGDIIKFHTYFKITGYPQSGDEIVNILINGSRISVGPSDMLEAETTTEFINRVYIEHKNIKL